MSDKHYTAERAEDDRILVHMPGMGYGLELEEARKLRDSLDAVLPAAVEQLKVGDLARTPFEPSALVKILQIESDHYIYGVTVRVEFLEDHSGYQKGEVGRYQLSELRRLEAKEK